MSVSSFLTTVFEFCMVAALIWCFFHEDRLVAFERRIFSHFKRRRLHIVKQESYFGAVKANR